MRTRTLATVVICLAISSYASAAPSTKQILQNIHKTYASMKSLEISGTSTESVSVAGKSQSQTATYKVAFQRPAKLRYEVTQGPNKQMIVCDGKNVYSADLKAKIYQKMPLKNGLKGLAGLGGVGINSMALLVGLDPTKLADKTKVAGQARINGADSYILQVTVNSKNSNAVQKLWVGKKDWLIRKNELKVTASSKKGPGTISSLTTATRIRANGPITASAFNFVPPKGAKLFDPKKVAAKQQQAIQKMAKALDGKPAPQITLSDIKGKKFSLSSTKGKVVLVCFWASRHPLSKTQMPMLQKVCTANRSKGLEIVAVSIDPKPQDVKVFASKGKLTYNILTGSPKELQQVAKSYGLVTIPSVYVINKSGTVVTHFLGVPKEAQLTAALKKAGL